MVQLLPPLPSPSFFRARSLLLRFSLLSPSFPHCSMSASLVFCIGLFRSSCLHFALFLSAFRTLSQHFLFTLLRPIAPCLRPTRALTCSTCVPVVLAREGQPVRRSAECGLPQRGQHGRKQNLRRLVLLNVQFSAVLFSSVQNELAESPPRHTHTLSLLLLLLCGHDTRFNFRC